MKNPRCHKKCYIFYIIKKDWLSPYCTTLATSFIKEHIPSNLHKQEVDVVGQLVGFDTRMQDKKVLILVKCNDYKIGVCIMYNFRNSDLYHIKNMNRLFPRPWSWTPSRKMQLMVLEENAREISSLIFNLSLLCYYPRYPFLNSVYVLELSDKLGILNWRNACLSYKLLYTILHELLFYSKPIFIFRMALLCNRLWFLSKGRQRMLLLFILFWFNRKVQLFYSTKVCANFRRMRKFQNLFISIIWLIIYPILLLKISTIK